MPANDSSHGAQGHDEAAFAQVFNSHADAVYGYCFRRSADWAAAEDLTSIVFMEAWRKRASADLAGANLLAWLLGIATNVLRNERRSRRRYRGALRRLPPLEPERDFADDACERLEAQRRMRALLSQIRRLPRREQDVLFLWASGLRSADISNVLGVAEGTVRTRLFRARTRLGRLGLMRAADLDVPVTSPKESVQ